MLTADGRTVFIPPREGAYIPGFPDCRVVGYVDPTRNAPLVNGDSKTDLDCNIIVTTVDRAAVSKSENTIRDCLKPVRDKVVHLMPDCESIDYIGDIGDSIQVHRWTPLQMFRQSRVTKPVRAAFNYCRCLMFGDRDSLVLEDDVVLDDDWESRVLRALSKIPDKLFVLAVHQNWDWAIKGGPTDEVERFVSPILWHGEGTEAFVCHWAGTNAMFYPRSVLDAGIGRCILNELNTNPLAMTTAYDMLVSRWCYVANVPIYLMTPSAARNIGTVTSIEWNKGA